MSAFNSTYSFKLIYVFRVNDAAHEGMLKVGHATLNTDTPMEQLPPNCPQLDAAAHKRINQYAKTALLNDELLHTELAVRMRGNMPQMFTDKIVHQVLRNSGVEIVKHLDGVGVSDWVKADLVTVREALKAVKENRDGIESPTNKHNPIVLRAEQEEAITKTCKRFEKHKHMLWNAKMRFGKTVCALNVVKRMRYNRTLILTHRPVVVSGWKEDFYNVFVRGDGYYFGSRSEGMSLPSLQQSCRHYVYFASLQDLRGSSLVGGNFNKNDDVFSTEWDCVIIDEAHEGTLTKLGENVIKALSKSETRFLRLSGTPFNLLDNYSEDDTFTWDYVSEQEAKAKWYVKHIDGKNPYEELPKLNIFTYNLNKEISGYEDIGDKAFNFREFFRVWTGHVEQDGDTLPAGVNVGDFVHARDVRRFLDLMTKESTTTNYPFSTAAYRENFRHSFWMLPGVAAAQALKALMEEHPVFGSGAFQIVNIAGDGDEDNEDSNALRAVKAAIGEHPESNYTITLSCGKLTTGVTVPAWTAVFMLAGSYSTSAASYLQTIFRVQSPAIIGGKQKTECFAFDFAPDRTLRMVAEAGKLNTRAGGGTEEQREQMARFLNFCPVISGEGSRMVTYDVSHMLQELKKAYVERAVRSGFDDKYIYSDALGSLDKTQLKDFEELHGIIGKTKQSKKIEKIDIAVNGLTDEERKKAESAEKKKKQNEPLTPQEQEYLERLKAVRKNKERAISILRGISIRIPLLLFGADIEYGKDISIQDLTRIVDDESWEEFMPRGITKRLFKRFIKYYDPDVFVKAGNKIRAMARSADAQPPTERIKTIAQIFSCFRNPDKETVLTPWRVVNMHMTDCLGGYDFYDAAHENILDTPRIVIEPNVTPKTFLNPDARILELNAKTGLYSLFATYSIMRARVRKQRFQNRVVELRCWNDALKENIFILCKTKMGCSIVRRTLAGYTNAHVNVVAFHDILDVLKNRPQLFISRALRPSYYSSAHTSLRMKFNAIIGNPPYQVNDGSGASDDASNPVYDDFFRAAKSLQPDFLSLIMPSRWMVGGKAKLVPFRKEMMEDKHFVKFFDFEDAGELFEGQHIDGGICYSLWDKSHNGKMSYTYKPTTGETSTTIRDFAIGNQKIVIRDSNPNRMSLMEKTANHGCFSSLVSTTKPYGIRKDLFNKQEKYNESGGSENEFANSVKIWGVYGIKGGARRKSCYIKRSAVKKNQESIDKFKLFFTTSYSTGAINPPEIIVADPGTVCTETFLEVGPFATQGERDSCLSYMHTRFFKVMLFMGKGTMQVNQETFTFIPLVPFDREWNDEKLKQEFRLSLDEVKYIDSFF